MKKTVDFLKECGVFFVLTVNGDYPAGRPFGAVMEYNENLYISTGDMKAVYRQLKEHPQLQIVALKSGSRNWIRINGIAEECFDSNIKQAMLAECPILTMHFPSPDAPHFAVFRVQVTVIETY